MGDIANAKKRDEIYGDSGLLESAKNQPGVKEVMAVYDTWRTLDKTFQLHQQILGTTRIVSLSNNSGPVVREI